jgi:hypothetical protein
MQVEFGVFKQSPKANPETMEKINNTNAELKRFTGIINRFRHLNFANLLKTLIVGSFKNPVE